MRKVCLRADASDRIGYGHFIRTLALADMLKDDFDCTFFTKSPNAFQKDELQKVCRLVELPSDDSKYDEFLDYLSGAEIVVLDNYFYTSVYEKAIKDFLMAGFTGMTAGKPWDGREQVNGGYISVMDDGDVLCYHSNDREAFRDYLYRNTHFEYVAAEKYVWSRIEKIDGEYYLPLNISIRFNTKVR